MTNYNWPFRILPFGIFRSNLDTRDLRHILGPNLVIFNNVTFWQFQGHLNTFQKWVLSENQSFLNEGAVIIPLLV